MQQNNLYRKAYGQKLCENGVDLKSVSVQDNRFKTELVNNNNNDI